MFSINRYFRTLAVTLCCLLIYSACPLSWTQETQGSPPHLVITILEGEGALNNIRERTAHEPIIEVQDENHKPIAGAVVIFTLPGSGPSGVFANGTQVFSGVTDNAGRIAAHGLRPNNVSGQYDIHVKVTYNGSNAETTIHQKNVPGPSGNEQTTAHAAAHGLSLKTVLIIVSAAAAAGAVAGVIATRDNGTSTTSITAGPPSVGAPPAQGASIRIPVNLHHR